MPERTAEGFSGRKRSPRSATIALSSGAITSSPILCFLIALDPFDTIPCQNGGRKSKVFHRTRWITRPPLVIPLMVSEYDYKLYFRIATQLWQDLIASMDILIDPALVEQLKELGAVLAAPAVEDATRASDKATL